MWTRAATVWVPRRKKVCFSSCSKIATCPGRPPVAKSRTDFLAKTLSGRSLSREVNKVGDSFVAGVTMARADAC
jgi:hypothetical protein